MTEFTEGDVAHMLDHYFRCLIIGATGTGKSFFMTQMLFPYIQHRYDRVIIFTRETNITYYEINTRYFRANNQTWWEWLTGSRENFVKVCTDINSIIPTIRDIPNHQEIIGFDPDGTPRYKYNYLLVFDDILNARLVQDQTFVNLFTHYRHYQVSLFFIAQATSRIVPPNIRTQASVVIMTSTSQRDVRNNLLREYVYQLVEDDIFAHDARVRNLARSAYYKAIVEPRSRQFYYGLLVIDLKHEKLYYFDRDLYNETT